MERQLKPESKRELEQLRRSIQTRSEKLWSLERVDDFTYDMDELPGFTPTEDEQEQLRLEQEAEAILNDLNRDEDEAAVLARWNLPNEEDAAFFDALNEDPDQTLRREKIITFREDQLHKLMIQHLGKNYREAEIVTEWARSKNGKFYPVTKLNAVEWIHEAIADNGYDRLLGVAWCVFNLRKRIAGQQYRTRTSAF